MTTTVIISDLHINSTVAICPPSVQLDDGGTYHPSPGQSWLRYSFERFVETVKAKAWGDIYLIINGDLAEGDAKQRSLQTISRNPATIKTMAAEVLDPLAKLSADLFVIRGTPAHGGQSGNLEEGIADDLEAVKCPDTGASSWWGLLWEIDGVRMDIAHHPRGGTGARPFNVNSVADRLASDTVFEYANRGDRPPDLVIRSHLHRYLDSYQHFRTRAIITPAWTFATEFIHKIAPNSLADVGGILVHTSDGKYEVEPVRYEPCHPIYFTTGDLHANHHG